MVDLDFDPYRSASGRRTECPFHTELRGTRRLIDAPPEFLGERAANAVPIPKEQRRLVQTHRRRWLSLMRSRDAAMIARDGRPLG
jgi:hypothetical protein